jgi:uncharacterized protein YbbC (DUF1343 family)
VASLILAVFSAACAAAPTAHQSVRPGLEAFVEQPPPALLGRRIGLITNHTGIDGAGVSAIDRIAAGTSFQLVALFAPEHGIRGMAAPGERIESSRDSRSGLPIHSLYGETRAPTAAMLEGIEALLFDIQDVGARQYTYVSTMALAMQAAAARGIPFVVLDRPNPIGGEIVEGGLLDPAFASFVGMYPIPSRHGMTVGELAQLFNRRFGIGAELIVVPAEGWRRDAWFDDTGLPWVNPSPNIRRLEAATHYPGTVFLEGTNLSEGRGTTLPFEQTGAPWLDAEMVAARMTELDLPGVRFEPVRFAVDGGAGKYPGAELPGVRLIATDRRLYRPVNTVLRMIDLIRTTHPDEFRWSATMDRLAGTDELRRAIEEGALLPLLQRWEAEAEAFRATRAPFLLYE